MYLTMPSLGFLIQKWFNLFSIWNSHYFVIYNRRPTLKSRLGSKLLNYKLKNVIIKIYEKIIIQSLSSRKVFFKINLFLTKKIQKIFMYWSNLSINFQFQSFHRVYDRNWLNSKFCGGGPQVEPKPTSSVKNLQ